MKQDRQQELHFEDLAKQFTEDISRSKRIFSMEDAMQDNTMRKSVQKHRRKMKRKTVLEYAIAFSAIAVGLPVLLWYLYRQFLLFRQMPEVVQFYLQRPVLGVATLLGGGLVCMGTVPCEKIRACRKGVDKHVRILQKEKSTGAGI